MTSPNATEARRRVSNPAEDVADSSEEEHPGGTVRVFRPAASREFPPSRFRLPYTPKTREDTDDAQPHQYGQPAPRTSRVA